MLIRTILTVLNTCGSVACTRRNGTCRGFVYMNGETPDRQILELRDVCYIVGKVFSRRVQRRWNHVNRISGSGETVELCGEWLRQGGRQGRGVCAPRLVPQHSQGRLTSGMDGVESFRDEGIIFDPSNNPSISHMAYS